jgi:hypothetical protein
LPFGRLGRSVGHRFLRDFSSSARLQYSVSSAWCGLLWTASYVVSSAAGTLWAEQDRGSRSRACSASRDVYRRHPSRSADTQDQRGGAAIESPRFDACMPCYRAYLPAVVHLRVR